MIRGLTINVAAYTPFKCTYLRNFNSVLTNQNTKVMIKTVHFSHFCYSCNNIMISSLQGFRIYTVEQKDLLFNNCGRIVSAVI